MLPVKEHQINVSCGSINTDFYDGKKGFGLCGKFKLVSCVAFWNPLEVFLNSQCNLTLPVTRCPFQTYPGNRWRAQIPDYKGRVNCPIHLYCTEQGNAGSSFIYETLRQCFGDAYPVRFIYVYLLTYVQSPAYTLVWTRSGNGKLPNRAMDFNGILTIQNVQPEDAGVYICTGSNMFGMDEGRAILYVPGSWSLAPHSITHHALLPYQLWLPYFLILTHYPSPSSYSSACFSFHAVWCKHSAQG